MSRKRESPQDLYEVAKQKTRRLKPKERQAVIMYLEEQDEIQSNYQLAALFQCDEKAIRRDRQVVMQEYSSQITPDNAMKFVARYLKDQDELIRKAKAGLDQTTPGGLMHSKYVALLSDLQARKIKTLQDISVVPKELGHLSVTEEIWQASVSEDGVTGVQRVDGENN